MKTKIDEADKAATKALSFLIKQRIKNPSFVRTMAVRMSKRLGQNIKRQQLEAWLHPELEKRVRPALGVGLLLIAEGAKALDLKPRRNGKGRK